jgi:hypothetical protein
MSFVMLQVSTNIFLYSPSCENNLADIDFFMQNRPPLKRVEILRALSAQKREAKYSAMNIHYVALLNKSTATMIIHSPDSWLFQPRGSGDPRSGVAVTGCIICQMPPPARKWTAQQARARASR